MVNQIETYDEEYLGSRYYTPDGRKVDPNEVYFSNPDEMYTITKDGRKIPVLHIVEYLVSVSPVVPTIPLPPSVEQGEKVE